MEERGNNYVFSEDILVCRICLATDVKMFDLLLQPLQTYFESIFENNLADLQDLLHYGCYKCVALIRKFYLFKNQCFNVGALLHSALHTVEGISTEQIKAIKDENNFHPIQNLTSELLIEDTSFHFEFDDKPKEIKEEPIRDFSFEYVIDDDIKQEHFDDFPNTGLSSDDDEPLSYHKEKKIGKKEQTKLHVKTDFSALIPEGETPLKRKRGRPKKVKPRKQSSTGGRQSTAGITDDELGDFVTVVKLTTEQQHEELNQRQFSSNYLNSQYKCALCYKGFIDTDAWQHHLRKHDPVSGDLQCPVCKFRFKTRRVLQKHSTNHERKYYCKSCPNVSKNITQAKQHLGWHKGVTYKCEYCDELLNKWTSYLSHVRMKHPSQFICGVCGCSFVSKLGLSMHKTMMHKDVADKMERMEREGEGPYCAECDVRFISEQAYKRHILASVKHTQNAEISNGCRVCGDTFQTAEEMRIHHRKEHSKKRPKNYGKKPSEIDFPTKCLHCNTDVLNAREYWTHFRRVHPDKKYPIQKNYVCDICGKSFRGNAFLVYHKRTHFAERAFKCDQCPKAFFNRTNLQMHEKTHSDVRPYPCSVCLKAFKSKGALDRHFRSHTGAKPYECEVCGKGFGQSNSRKLHVRTVHLKQPAPYISRSRLEKKTRPQQKDLINPFCY